MGRIERDLLARIEASATSLDTFVLADMVFSPTVDEKNVAYLSDAQLVSVRRALKSLAVRGQVFKMFRGLNKRAYWASERLWLWHSIRAGQQKSLTIGSVDEFRAHAESLVVLIGRARSLGVDFDRPYSPPTGQERAA